jgi:O-antigen ligase
MIQLIIALIIIITFSIYWYKYIYEDNFDVIFLILGLSYLASSGMFLGNDWIIRFRHIILPSLACWTLFYFSKKKKYRNILSYNFIILFLWILAASLWSEEPKLAFQIKIKGVLYPIFFLIAGTYISDYGKIRKLVKALFFPACLVALAVVLGNKMHAEDFRLNIHNINSNSTAGYLGVSIMVMLNMWFFTDKKYKTAILILILFTSGFLFMTGSRTGTLSTLIGGTVVILPYLKNISSMVLTVFTVSISIIFFFYYFWVKLTSQVKTRIFDLSNMSGRSAFWQPHFEALAESPWFGVGTIYHYGYIGDSTWGSMLNIYLNIYIELGIIGSIIAGAFFIQLLYYMFYCHKNIDNNVKYFIFAIIIFALANGIGESMAMRGENPVALVFLIFIGILSNMKNNKDFFIPNCNLKNDLSTNGASR